MSYSFSTSQSCQDEEIDYEPDFLFIQPSDEDRVKAEGDEHMLADSVWYELKPPNRTHCIYQPFVSARQVEIVRTVLMGKNLPKIEISKFPGIPNPPAKTAKKIESVKNLKNPRSDSSL